MIISIENNLYQKAQSSFISTSVLSAGTALPVKNINSFTASHAVQIGKTGEEQAEIIVLGTSTPSGTALLFNGTAALRFNHNQDTPIYDINYDKIIVKRSTAGTSGTATTLATISITPDSLYTSYDDTGGSLTYAYKTTFYNSVTTSQSDDSAWFVPTGPTFYSLAKLRKRAKDALYSAGYIKNDDVLDDWINEWQEQMGNAAIKVNQSYALGTTTVTFDGSAGYGTITASDFKSPRKFEVAYTSTNGYVNSVEMPINQFSESDTFTSVYPRHSWAGDNVFQMRPYRNGGTARITYSKIYALLTAETDELSLVLRPYTTSCIEWCLYRSYANDEKVEMAENHYAKFKIGKEDFISEITPRDQSGPKTIQFDEAMSGREDDFDLEYFAI